MKPTTIEQNNTASVWRVKKLVSDWFEYKRWRGTLPALLIRLLVVLDYIYIYIYDSFMFLNLLVILLFPTNALELSLLYENIIQLKCYHYSVI